LDGDNVKNMEKPPPSSTPNACPRSPEPGVSSSPAKSNGSIFLVIAGFFVAFFLCGSHYWAMLICITAYLVVPACCALRSPQSAGIVRLIAFLVFPPYCWYYVAKPYTGSLGAIALGIWTAIYAFAFSEYTRGLTREYPIAVGIAYWGIPLVYLGTCVSGIINDIRRIRKNQ
jgi:hypothetical protein